MKIPSIEAMNLLDLPDTGEQEIVTGPFVVVTPDGEALGMFLRLSDVETDKGEAVGWGDIMGERVRLFPNGADIRQVGDTYVISEGDAEVATVRPVTEDDWGLYDGGAGTVEELVAKIRSDLEENSFVAEIPEIPQGEKGGLIAFYTRPGEQDGEVTRIAYWNNGRFKVIGKPKTPAYEDARTSMETLVNLPPSEAWGSYVRPWNGYGDQPMVMNFDEGKDKMMATLRSWNIRKNQSWEEVRSNG